MFLVLFIFIIFSSPSWGQKYDTEIVPAVSMGLLKDFGVSVTCNAYPKKGFIGAFAEANLEIIQDYANKNSASYGLTAGPKFGKHILLGVNIQSLKGYSAPFIGAELGGDIRLFKNKLSVSPRVRMSKPIQKSEGVSWAGPPEVRLKLGYVISNKKEEKK